MLITLWITYVDLLWLAVILQQKKGLKQIGQHYTYGGCLGTSTQYYEKRSH
jgi:hypothetical protein